MVVLGTVIASAQEPALPLVLVVHTMLVLAMVLLGGAQGIAIITVLARALEIVTELVEGAVMLIAFPVVKTHQLVQLIA